MLEVEVKIKTDHKHIIEKLEKLGFVKTTTEYEKDTYFNSPYLDIKALDKALRIRQQQNMDTSESSCVMNYKGPKLDRITMTREEVEFEIPSYEIGETLLKGLGYQTAGTVEKTRVHWEKDTITCCLDQVTGLGSYLEIEILSDESGYDAALSKIEALLKSLNLSMADTERRSYLSMLEL